MGLRQFREHYGDDGITDEDAFAYIYATLHDPPTGSGTRLTCAAIFLGCTSR